MSACKPHCTGGEAGDCIPHIFRFYPQAICWLNFSPRKKHVNRKTNSTKVFTFTLTGVRHRLARVDNGLILYDLGCSLFLSWRRRLLQRCKVEITLRDFDTQKIAVLRDVLNISNTGQVGKACAGRVRATAARTGSVRDLWSAPFKIDSKPIF